ncbi:NMD3-related protein [Nanoarchaeota archaeon]
MPNQYFEGILQLRNPNSLVIEFVYRQMEEKKGVFISKEVRMTNGVDLYFSSQRFLGNLGRKLQKTFGGELKMNSSLHTKDHLSSKGLYRVNVYFRLPTVKKGDIVTVKGEEFEILGMGKKVIGKSLETGKKARLEYADLP